ncbi:MAG: endolytic transglycosylase MltG [Acutalibacteraceae bacterium]|nr:endolytic transglycosylase MltG [Acutalibacteraceae bacterium]
MQENNDLFKRPSENNNNACEEQFKTKIFGKSIDEIINDESAEDYQSASENEDMVNFSSKKKNKKKKRNGIPTFIRILIILAISFALAASIIFAVIDFLGLTFKNDKTAEIDIKSGFSTAQIADELHDKGVIKFPVLFRLYSKLKGADGSYQYGIYEIKDSQSYDGIINTLKTSGESGEVATVTIPEGYSVRKIAELMEKKGICSKDEFISAVKNTEYDYDFIKDIPTQSVYYRLEGYLYPDTYHFFINSDGKSGQSCAEKAVRKMLDKMNSVITDEMKESAEKRGYSIHEILTMASIVELEASGYPDDMAKVAQVFYNRLRWTDQPAMLGSTPTSDYPDSRYNTNKYEGLPPGPLCSPSITAINAALNPDTSVKECYFVTDKNMKFYYTNSLSEHNELIEKLKSEGLWN